VLLAPDAAPTATTIPVSLNLPAASTTDPWGNAIQYARTTSPIDAGTNGSLTAFTLTSYGPDATAGTSDDIVITVTVSEFQSLVAKFR